MEYLAKIIHQTHISYLPTSYAVQFYGMPNGKVLFTYARDSVPKPYQEFVFAEHKEFSFDYKRGKLMMHKNGTIKDAINNEMVDKPGPQYIVFKVSTKIRSYTEAFTEINQLANEIINEIQVKKTKIINSELGMNALVNVG